MLYQIIIIMFDIEIFDIEFSYFSLMIFFNDFFFRKTFGNESRERKESHVEVYHNKLK